MSIPFAPLARATLHAGGRSADYLTGGRGAAVVVMHPLSEGELAYPLLAALAARHRVVAPLTLGEGACSLGDLFEGLGIERAALVVAATVADAAIAFVTGRGDRVSRVAVLRSRDADLAAVLSRWSDASHAARVWVEADVVHDPAALDELLTYLAASAMP